MKLEQHMIVDAALALLDEEGLDALNMRALAGRLDVQASALYWHVGDKSDLLRLMSARFYGKAIEDAPKGAGWRNWLRGYGQSFRIALLTHRDSARLLAVAKPPDDVQAASEYLARPLVESGLDIRTALTYQSSVIAFTLGWCLYEQSDAMHDHLAKLVGFERSYTIGLEALVKGFAAPK